MMFTLAAVATSWLVMSCTPKECIYIKGNVPSEAICEAILEETYREMAKNLGAPSPWILKVEMDARGFTFDCIPSKALSARGTE